MKVEVELPEIKGYEYIGEYRNVVKDEYYLSDINDGIFGVIKAETDSIVFRHILRKKKEKLTRKQIMNEWLWDKTVKVAFKVICIDGQDCYKVSSGEIIKSNFEYTQNYCELYYKE